MAVLTTPRITLAGCPSAAAAKSWVRKASSKVTYFALYPGVSALMMLSKVARCLVHWKFMDRSSIKKELEKKNPLLI